MDFLSSAILNQKLRGKCHSQVNLEGDLLKTEHTESGAVGHSTKSTSRFHCQSLGPFHTRDAIGSACPFFRRTRSDPLFFSMGSRTCVHLHMATFDATWQKQMEGDPFPSFWSDWRTAMCKQITCLFTSDCP